jgi:hypothetical protein
LWTGQISGVPHIPYNKEERKDSPVKNGAPGDEKNEKKKPQSHFWKS